MRNLRSLKYVARRFLTTLGIDVYPADYRNSVQSYLEFLIGTRGVSSVIDVGANEGQYASMLRNIGFRGNIYSYEPLKEPWSLLNKKASRDSKWTVAERSAVVASNDDLVTLFETDDSVSSSILSPLDGQKFSTVKKVQCPAVNINQVLNSHCDCKLLKLDVQGFEASLIEGIDPGVSYFPQFLQLELAISQTYDGEKLYETVNSFLFELGYTPIFIFPGVADDKGRIVQVECVYEYRPSKSGNA